MRWVRVVMMSVQWNPHAHDPYHAAHFAVVDAVMMGEVTLVGMYSGPLPLDVQTQ